jgi:CRISPR-associated protein Csm1
MESANGNAFLYRLKSYIEETQRNPNERINIARFAYLLARMAPSEKNSELLEVYSKFSLKMYGWILNAEDRQQLLTAITIYFYLKRSVDDK